jgi:hypothetical protein
MCLIAYSPKGALIPRDVSIEAHNTNPDGIGIMSRLGVVKFYGRKANKKAYRYMQRNFGEHTGIPYAVHWRWRTHGTVGLINVHPFEVAAGNGYLMHNGVIGWCGTDDDMSDTAVFASLLDYYPGSYDSVYKRELEDLVGYGNKLCIFNKLDESFTLVNDYESDYKEGIWYSNEYSLPTRLCSKWLQNYNANYAKRPARFNSGSGRSNYVKDYYWDSVETLATKPITTNTYNGSVVEYVPGPMDEQRESDDYMLPTPYGYRDAYPPACDTTGSDDDADLIDDDEATQTYYESLEADVRTAELLQDRGHNVDTFGDPAFDDTELAEQSGEFARIILPPEVKKPKATLQQIRARSIRKPKVTLKGKVIS